MKPTQEQVIAWAREAGFATSWTEAAGEALLTFAAFAYEAGRKDEVNRIVNLLSIQHEVASTHNYWLAAARLVQGENNDSD